MNAEFSRGHVSLSVGWRLVAGLLPSLLAVGLVAGLFYYGVAGRTAPRLILIISTALTIASLVVTWVNARYFARRIARLAHATASAIGDGARVDEFDRIEQGVDNLGSALSAAEAERARADAVAATQRREEATMLAAVVTDSLSQLDEVRLPLHILLDSKFGDLNENQEELLRDARNAADAIDTALRRLGQVADADRGAMQVQRELVQINDVVRSVLPLARAAAERQGARVEVSLEPGLQRAFADRARLAAALTLLTTDAARKTGPQIPLSISTSREGASAMVRIVPSAEISILASRLISVQGGQLSLKDGACIVRVGA
jgi:signal transduction histidine kinase